MPDHRCSDVTCGICAVGTLSSNIVEAHLQLGGLQTLGSHVPASCKSLFDICGIDKALCTRTANIRIKKLFNFIVSILSSPKLFSKRIISTNLMSDCCWTVLYIGIAFRDRIFSRYDRVHNYFINIFCWRLYSDVIDEVMLLNIAKTFTSN